MNSEAVEHHNLFNVEQMNKMISDGEASPGIPFTVHYGTGTISAVMWSGGSSKVIEIVKTAQSFPEVFVQVLQSASSDQASWCTFNLGCRHYPLRLALKDIYANSAEYCPLEKMTRASDCNHNLLRIFQLLLAISDFFIRLEDAGLAYLVCQVEKTVQQLASELLHHLWIRDGNMMKSDLFSPDLIVASPFDIGMGKSSDDDLADIMTSFCGSNYLLRIFREIAKQAFRLRSGDGLQAETRVRENPFRCLSEILSWISHPTHSSSLKTLVDVRKILQEGLEWFSENRHWPQIIWNDMLVQCNYLKEDRVLEFDCYSQECVSDLREKVDITGAAWWPRPKEDSTFINRPLLIMLAVQDGELYCKIAFDVLMTANHCNLASDALRINSRESAIERNGIVRNIPEAFKKFVAEIASLHAGGVILPQKMILERTTLYFDSNSRESKFKLCLYNAAKVLKKKSFCVYSVKYPKLAKNLYAMLEAFPGQPDTEKQNCWEIALLLVALYKYLIHIRKSRLERSRSLYTYLFEFQSGLKDRIWLFPYRGGWTFSLLAAHMLQRDVDSIPSARELISSKYFLRWMIERDLFQCYVRYRAEHDFAALSKEEFQEFQQISMMVNTGYMLEEAIVLQSNWREIKNNLTNAEKVIATFTHYLKNPRFTSVLLRNRRPIPLIFSHHGADGDFYEQGEGRGVFQDGLTLYGQSLSETGLFLPHCRRSNVMYTASNVNQNHWYVLGLLLGNALLNNLGFFIDQPQCFFKILLEGIQHFDVMDLADLDREECIRLLKLFFMSQQQLDELCVELQDSGENPMLQGNLTVGMVEIYISELCKTRILREYSFNGRPSWIDLEELRRGFHTSCSDTKVTSRQLWMMFGQSLEMDPQCLLSHMSFNAELSTSISHSDRCLQSKHILGSGALCPLSCLARFVRSCSQDTLQNLLYFITGSQSIGYSNFQEICIQLHELSEQTDHLPYASTCIRTLFLYYDFLSTTDEEESFAQFSRKMEMALAEGMSFGVR